MREWLRPLTAAVLALLIAGLGHAYLRRWGRAALWFATILGGGLALSALYAEPGATGPLDLPARVIVPTVTLFAASAVDAFLIARGEMGGREGSRPAAVTGAGSGVDSAESESGPGPGAGAGSGTTSPTTGDAADGAEAANAGGPGEPPTVTCPHCGEETDGELDFCHWCTEPLDTTGTED